MDISFAQDAFAQQKPEFTWPTGVTGFVLSDLVPSEPFELPNFNAFVQGHTQSAEMRLRAEEQINLLQEPGSRDAQETGTDIESLTETESNSPAIAKLPKTKKVEVMNNLEESLRPIKQGRPVADRVVSD